MAGEANIWNPRTLIEISADTKSVEERITAIEGQTFFTLTDFVYVVDTGALEVHKNGLLLAKGTDWVENTSSTFSIVIPATAGDQIVATGATAITGDVDVRDTDIFVANYQAIRDYAGTETSLYTQGAVITADKGEGFYSKVTGAAPGTFVDNNLDVIIPTGGDGSIGWLRNTATRVEGDKRYAPLFATVAAMTAANPVSIDGIAVIITAGMTIRTQGYDAAGDGGGAKYLGVASQAVDGVGDHDAANGVSLILQHKGIIHSSWFNIPFDGTDAATNLQAWNDYIVAESAIGRLAKKSAVYTVKSQVNFSTSFYSSKAILKMNGAFAALGVFSGTENVVEGIIFEGNTTDGVTQALSGTLTEILTTTQMMFRNCMWRGIKGVTQNQYGIELSAEDSDVEFIECSFKDISATGTNPPQEGVSPGFTGGIFMQLGNTPVKPTRLRVSSCTFQDIQTLRHPDDVSGDPVDYDADAIRFFITQTDNETAPRHDIIIENCRFFNVQKRCVKNTGVDGLVVDGVTVEAFNNTDSTRPNMLSVVSLQPAKNCVVRNVKAVGRFNYIMRFVAADCEFSSINFDSRYSGYVHYMFGMEDRGALLERNIVIRDVVGRGVERLFRSIDQTGLGSGSAFYRNERLRVHNIDVGYATPIEGGFTSGTDHFFKLENLSDALFENINIYADDTPTGEIEIKGILLDRCENVTFRNLTGNFSNMLLEVNDATAGAIVTKNIILDNCISMREGTVAPDDSYIRTPATADNCKILGGKYTLQSTAADVSFSLVRLTGDNNLEQGVEYFSEDFGSNAFLPFALNQPAGADYMVKDCMYTNNGTETPVWMQSSSVGMRLIGCNTNEGLVTISSVGDIFQSNSNPTGKTQAGGAGSFTVSGNNLQY